VSRLNWIFTLSSLSVLLVTIERFSFTAKVLLNPYNFLRLHELVQISIVILLTIIVPTLLLFEVTSKFSEIKKRDLLLIMTFIVGVYFYSAGNGVHELASFMLNQYCDLKNLTGNLCKGLFFNDYYFGNITYFVGGFLMVASLLLIEFKRPNKSYAKKDLLITIVNGVIYSFAIFAYIAFDRVLVGLVYSLITTVFSLGLFFVVRKKYLKYPLITYTTLTYFLGTSAAIIVRFLR